MRISDWSSDVYSSDLELGLGQRAEGQAELVLRRRDLMVMLVAGQAHLQHRRDHLGADVDRAVDRRDGEIAALGAGPVGEVAALIGAAGVGGQLDIVAPEAGLVVARLEADTVRLEKCGTGAEPTR